MSYAVPSNYKAIAFYMLPKTNDLVSLEFEDVLERPLRVIFLLLVFE